ncbi:alpha/beta fold hydrolase [Rhodococcus sp. NBC_00297]|uniref:alpha/beta fold hydrolase n=1 Tax=Rhodococcus sp. NBC_00297 TaxID=2976005 RepID=UPI002E2C5192|nr:alpha/beta hydrolase [Rhodococcus sp. NBC_00297]
MIMTDGVVDAEGVRLHYRDSGGADVLGSPVVLVHGMGGDGHTWDAFARTLVRRGRRVVVPDLRGHGRSGRARSYLFGEFGDDLEALLDHLSLTRVDLVGHSLGGHAATLVAQRRPTTVRKLVVEEAPLPIRPGDETPSITTKFPSARELLHATTSVIRHPRAVLAFDRSMTSSALTQFRAPDPLWWEALAHMESDVLLVVGGPTGMVDRARLEAMTALVPRSRVVAVDSGHSVHRDRFAEFDAAVGPFLAEHQETPRAL